MSRKRASAARTKAAPKRHTRNDRTAVARASGQSGPARFFAALGDDVRLRLLGRLGAGRPLSIAALGEGEQITRQAVSKHLRVLEGAGLLRGIRFGREQLWQLEREQLDQARAALELISQQWDAALGRLKDLVESDP